MRQCRPHSRWPYRRISGVTFTILIVQIYGIFPHDFPVDVEVPENMHIFGNK